MTGVINRQQIKTYDGGGLSPDGSAAGDLVRVKFDQAGLVPVGARSFMGAYGQSFGASGGVGNGMVMDYANTGVPGYVTITNASQANETLQAGIVWSTRFMGRRLALWLIGYFPFDPTLVVYVNREIKVAGKLGGMRVNGLNLGVKGSFTDGFCMIPVCDDLPDDGPHSLEVTVAPEQAGASQVALHALMVEERVGYRPDQRQALQQQPTVLLASAVNIALGTRQAIHAVEYRNVDFSALGTALTTGSAITSLATSAIPFAYAAGKAITVAGDGQSQTFIVGSGGAAAAATSVPVVSQTPSYAFPVGSTVGAAHTVTITVNGYGVQQPIPPGGLWLWQPGAGQPVALPNVPQHKADVASTIIAFPVTVL